MAGSLIDDVRALLDRALRELTDPGARGAVLAARRRLDEPLRVAIAGTVKAGKSTLLNAMVGEELAPTDAGECTRLVTWYRDGPEYRVTAHLADGREERRPFDRIGGALAVSLGRPAAEVGHLTVEVPSSRLRRHTLIDTPGLASLSADVSMRTMAFLGAGTDDGEPPPRSAADAVIYLMRHMHGSDLRFLEAFHRDELAHGTPVTAIGVLSRADEVGACRLDAMESAARVAARYQSDPRLRRLCPVVVPVAGLLAAAGATLREDEYATLARIARSPVGDVVELLLTADRFTTGRSDVGVERRGRLLARLGLFGVRLGVRLIREGTVRDGAGLAAELTARSGLVRLREALDAQFVGRSQVLRARSALAALDEVLRAEPAAGPGPAVAGLSGVAERIRAGAHELVEVRLLHLLRAGRLTDRLAMRAERLAEMERLLGGHGTDPVDRLDLPPDAAPEAVADAAGRALNRWRQVVEHPLSNSDLRTAATAVTRSCEGILAAPGGGWAPPGRATG